MKFFSLKAFILGLMIGLFFIYIIEPKYKKIYVYPTPENINDIQYVDKANNCFSFVANKKECSQDDSNIKNIPIQQ